MKFRIKKIDVIASLILLFGFLLLLFLFRYKPPGEVAYVEFKGEEIMQLSLEGEQQEIPLPHNENIILSYGSDGICFVASSCPDKVCIHAGCLSKAGEVAACLPNETVVSVIGEGADIVV